MYTLQGLVRHSKRLGHRKLLKKIKKRKKEFYAAAILLVK